MTEPSSAPILDLATLAPEHPTILIDGRSYDLAVSADFGAITGRRMQALFQRLANLENKPMEELTDADEAEYSAVLAKLGGMVIRGVPAETLAALGPDALAVVVSAFLQLAAPSAATAQLRARFPAMTPTTEAAAVIPSIGGLSSLDSPDSTVPTDG